VIPFPLQESYYDYLIDSFPALGHSSEKKQAKKKQANRLKESLNRSKESLNRPKEILIAASPRHKIEEWVERMAALGLKLMMVTEASLSMQRALNFIGAPGVPEAPLLGLASAAESMDIESMGIIALLDLGKTITTLYVLKKNRLFLRRELVSCPEVLTEDMQFLLCDQIKMVLQDFLPDTERVLLKHLFLAGESVLINQANVFIAKTLEISTTIADPVSKVLFSKKMGEVDREKIIAQTSGLLPCFGLLLSALDTRQKNENIRKINLLPWRTELRKASNKIFFLLLSFSAALGLCWIGGQQYYLYCQKQQEEIKIAYLEKEKNNIAAKIHKMKKWQKDKQDIISRLKIIQALQRDREKWLKFFDVLPRLLPEAVCLNDFSVKNEMIFFEGNARTHSKNHAKNHSKNHAKNHSKNHAHNHENGVLIFL